MKRKVFFYTQKKNFLNLKKYIKKHLRGIKVANGEKLPKNPEKYNLIILWNVTKVVKPIPSSKNIVVFHSSDLPKGRGWAPIFNAIKNKNVFHTISAIMVNNKIDRGDIILKAKFKIPNYYNAEFLRKADEDLCIKLVKLIVNKFKKKSIKSKKQKGKSSYFKKRYNFDNKVNISKNFKTLVPFLRACEKNHPAYFIWRKEQYLIKVYPTKKFKYPKKVKILFNT